jgi:hypothetical protein
MAVRVKTGLRVSDAANSWIINAANAGMFNGKPFKDIENLEGGADEDVFLFAGGRIGSVDGGRL